MYITTEDMRKIIDKALSRTVRHPANEIKDECYGYMRGCLELLDALLTEEKEDE